MGKKTLEQYLAGLTGAQMSAAMLKFWSQAGGVENGANTLERWRAGTLRIRFETVASSPRSQTPAITGTVIKDITIPGYAEICFAEAIRLGKFDNDSASPLDDTVRLFGEVRVGLDAPVRMEFVRFDRNYCMSEALAWGKEHGKKRPINISHLMGIAIRLPDELREYTVVESGTMSGDGTFYLYHIDKWRYLDHCVLGIPLDQNYLVGFVSESA